MLGQHTLKTWATTQKNITLSSGEAELVALVKASTEGIGMQQLASEWEFKYEVAFFADSSAALSVTQRKGAGKMRHIKIGMLWVQEKAENELIQYRKVRGDGNPADLMTKHLSAKKIDSCAAMMNLGWLEGRSSSSLKVV